MEDSDADTGVGEEGDFSEEEDASHELEPLSEEDLGMIEALLDIPDLTDVSLDVGVKSWIDGTPVATVSLVPSVFGVPVRRDVVHDVVRWQLAKRRSGNGQVSTGWRVFVMSVTRVGVRP